MILPLKEKFHLKSFRLGQMEIIDSVNSGQDVLAVMPTGGGKSLCYQLPAYTKAGITIVISPLIALMNDQVNSLQRLGLPAGSIHSGLSVVERRTVFENMKTAIENKTGYILYLSPERLQKQGFIDWVKNQPIDLFAVDEAHCLSLIHI